MNEAKIVAAIVGSRESWSLIREHLDQRELGPDTVKILSLVGDYYNADGMANSVDIEIISERIKREIPSEKHSRMLVDVLRNLPNTSGINVATEILEVKRHNKGLELAAALGRGDSREAIDRLISDYSGIFSSGIPGSQDEEVVETFKVRDLVEKSFDKSKLIQLWPMVLNEHLDGGARPGHHILVFAPTEMGKTLILVNMVAGFVNQNLGVLYVGNEDPVADLQMRYINRITRRTKKQVLDDPDGTQAILDKRKYENVIFAPLAPGTFPKIRKLVDRFDPAVVVLDQLRNIDVDSENRTQALEKAATEARNLAKSAGVLVVSVTQAGDSASGKRILNRGDVDGSNVGIPGQTDVMIGIGANEDDEAHNRRTFSFPKNKISGKHGSIMVEIVPELSLVKEKEAVNDAEFRGNKAPSVSRAA